MNVQFRALSPQHDGGYILSRIPNLNYMSDTKGIIAVEIDSNKTIGALIFDSWTKTACQVHMVIDNPLLLRHGFLEEGFEFVFGFCGRRIIHGIMPSSNVKALKLDRHIGFKEVYRVVDGYDEGVDMVILEMRKEDCSKWWKPAKEVSNG